MQVLPHTNSLHMDIHTTFYIKLEMFFFLKLWICMMEPNHIAIRLRQSTACILLESTLCDWVHYTKSYAWEKADKEVSNRVQRCNITLIFKHCCNKLSVLTSIQPFPASKPGNCLSFLMPPPTCTGHTQMLIGRTYSFQYLFIKWGGGVIPIHLG